eukprot:7018205-Pyramimonas_sp.AAC.1
MELKAIINESLKEKGQNGQHSLQIADRKAAIIERTKEMARPIGLETFPYIEKEFDALPKL